MTMLIMSCDKFSDLWDGHVRLLEENWKNRGMKTYIVTDEPTQTSYDSVSVFATDEGMEWSQRLGRALELVQTEYVFFTLDDYFLIKPVDGKKIENLLSIMKKEKLDFFRLNDRPTPSYGKKYAGYKKIYHLKTEACYSVNLGLGIWRTDFLKKTIREPRNIWRFEVSLSRIARETGARCAGSCNKELTILDVVRKGKLLGKAARYFKKHGVYYGEREKMGAWAEFKLGVRSKCVRYMPKWISDKARKFMIKRGHYYYSQDDEVRDNQGKDGKE